MDYISFAQYNKNNLLQFKYHYQSVKRRKRTYQWIFECRRRHYPFSITANGPRKERTASQGRIIFTTYTGSQTIDLLLLSLQEIEISRARIRSLSLYSPLESVLQNAIFNYIKHRRVKKETESASNCSRKVEINQLFSNVSYQNPDHE